MNRALVSCPSRGDNWVGWVMDVSADDGTVTVQPVDADTMRDKCFFIHHNKCSGFGLSNVHRYGLHGNRVYFLDRGSKYLYCFNMEDNSCSVSLPCPNLHTQWYMPMWVMPQYRLQSLRQAGHVNDHDKQAEKVKSDVDVDHGDPDSDPEEEQISSNPNNGTHLFDFHPDVIRFIAGKLHPIDYLSFRASCVGGRLVCPPKHWRTVLAEVDGITSSSAWLVFPNYDVRIWNFIVPDHDPRYMITTPKSLEHATIRTSKHGWLLLSCSISQEHMVFFNPFTKALIPLPDLPNDNIHENGPWVGFTFLSSPTSHELIVVGISWFPTARVAIFRPGYDKWRILNFENNLRFMVNYNNPVFWNGSFYFLGDDGRMGVLVEKDDWEWKVLDTPKPPCSNFRQNFLVECGGELMSVFVGVMGSSMISVFKLDRNKREWQKVESLGDHVLYVSRSSSFSMLARIQGMGNKIYFPSVYREGLVFYSLNTGKLYSDGSGVEPFEGFLQHKRETIMWLDRT